MELQVKPYVMPAALEFNYEEIKAALTEKIHVYETMVYGEDQIKQAKADRADLNKLKDALNDERKRREKEYMAPFAEFKTKIDELIGIIAKPVAIIDQQVKDYEKKKKEEKKDQILGLFKEAGFPDYIPFEHVFNEAWLNSSCSMARVKEDLKTLLMKNEKAVKTINALPEYSFEAMEIYKKTLDLSDAITKATEMGRIAKAKKEAAEAAARKAELERVAAEQRRAEEEARKAAAEQNTTEVPAPEPAKEQPLPGTWTRFEAFLTKDTAKMLADFFKDNNIAFRPIK